MGHTRSTSRSVSSTWFVPYDLDLPENKTVSQLKDGFTKRGINFLANAKKPQLFKLWKNNVIRMTQICKDVHKYGNLHATMSTMALTMERSVNRVESREEPTTPIGFDYTSM